MMEMEFGEGLPKLPKGWVSAKITDVCELINGRAFKPNEWASEGLPIIRIQNLNDDRANFNYCNFTVEEKYFVNNGELLFAWSGTPGTSFGAHIWKRGKAVLNQHIFRVIINEECIDKVFLMHLLNQNVDEYIRKAHGTAGLAHITKGKFGNSYIPISPLPEQHRIVAKIEELFTRLDAGVEALKKIKAQLKLYRQAVLKYAFEGKLTQEWRETNKGKIEPASILLERIKEQRKKEAKGKFKELPPIDTSELPELPNGWAWATMEQISTKVVDGVHKKPDYVSKGIPFVTVSNLTAGDEIDFQRVRYISDEDHKNFSKRANPEKGDILITKDGTLGIARAVKTENQFSIFVSVAMMKPIKKYVNSDYLAAFINSPIGQSQTRKIGEGSGLRHLHLEDLRTIPFPIAPFLEQQKIMEEIESRLSIADNMEKVVDQSLKQSERLRQSILKRAFEGKLVPQDPTDEPAEKLLERIKEEKAKREVESKRGKKTSFHRRQNHEQKT